MSSGNEKDLYERWDASSKNLVNPHGGANPEEQDEATNMEADRRQQALVVQSPLGILLETVVNLPLRLWRNSTPQQICRVQHEARGGKEK